MIRRHAPTLTVVPSAKDIVLSRWPGCTCAHSPYADGIAVYVIFLPSKRAIAWGGNEATAWKSAMELLDKHPGLYAAPVAPVAPAAPADAVPVLTMQVKKRELSLV